MPKYRLFPTSQVKGIFNYFNIKRKLLSCNADIKFNQTCLLNGFTPKYATVKCTGNSVPSKRTKRTAEILRTKNEIKFLYVKKQQLNKRLYESHLYIAQIWDKVWNMIEININEKLEKIMQRKYMWYIVEN
jgi:hypothetical protein